MQSQEKCVKCDSAFSQNNLARIIPNCGHNICSECVKSLIKNKQTRIKCKGCNQFIQIQESELQSFPKNITILKQIRESSQVASVASLDKLGKKMTQNDDTDINSGSILIDSSKYSQISDRSSSNTCPLCPMHGKPLQIICIEDHGLLCPHCAIFGQHRNHQFKTLEQFDDELKTYQKGLKQISGRKKNADFKIKGDIYMREVVNQINSKKNELITEIKEKFRKIQQYLRNAQQRVYTELVDAFRNIDAQINKMTKEENKLETTYEEWKRNAYDYLSKIEHGREIIDKVGLFYDKSKPQLVDGNAYVQEIEEKNAGINDMIRSMIRSIHMEYSVSIQGYIYNYARVVSTAVNLTEKTIDLTPRSVSQKKKKQKKKSAQVQFVKSDAFGNIQAPSIISQKKGAIIIKPPKSKSPQINQVRSNPKPRIDKKIKSPNKNFSPNKNKPEQQQINNANLEFAERMLNQFKISTDTLDLTGCDLGDKQISYLVDLASAQKPIKCLKLSKNKLTTTGLKHILGQLESTTNLNISHNLLGDDSMDQLIKFRETMPHLRIVNISHNKLNERKVKSKVEELKRLGIIITL